MRDRVRLAAWRHRRRRSSTRASVRAAATGGRVSRGVDAGETVNGGQQHLAVDTLGLLLCVLLTAASVQHRAGARPLLDLLSRSCHQVRLVWAERGYAGKRVCWAGAHPGLTIQVIQRPTEATRFLVLPRRWVVEPALAWIARHRRCVPDYVRLPAHHKAMARCSMIRLASRHLAKPI